MANVDDKMIELHYKHYTDLFIYQARQRIDSIRFYLIAVAVASNVIVDSGSSNFAKAVIATVAGLVTIIFLRLDYRNAQIVELDEKPLKYLQSITQSKMNASNEWVTFREAERKGFWVSYGTLVPILYSLIWISWFCAAVIFAFRWIESRDLPQFYAQIFCVLLIVVGLLGTFCGKPEKPKDVTPIARPPSA